MSSFIVQLPHHCQQCGTWFPYEKIIGGPGLFTHLGWVDMPHGHCSWSVSVSGGGGVVVVIPLWGLASWALVVLKIAINMAWSDEPFACHVSGLVVALLVGHHHCCWYSLSQLLWVWALSVVEASVCGLWVVGEGGCCAYGGGGKRKVVDC